MAKGCPGAAVPDKTAVWPTPQRDRSDDRTIGLSVYIEFGTLTLRGSGMSPLPERYQPMVAER